MTARAIVEQGDVVGDVGPRRFAVSIDLFLDPLLLQTAEEGLDDGVVPAVALATHARLQVIGVAEAAPRVAAVLATPRPGMIRISHNSAGFVSGLSLTARDAVKR